MGTVTNRRAFLSARMLRRKSDVIRPPGAIEDRFDDLCSACGDCAQACPEEIIAFGQDGYPFVQLQTSPCTFCGECARSCATGALEVDHMDAWPWRARVENTCLSLNGVSCRVCHDSCDHDAIRFKLQLGGRAQPVLDRDACAGCGACAASCPAGAIALERQSEHQSKAAQ